MHDYDRAIKNCSAAIWLKPDDPDYYDTRGKAYEKQGDAERAEADFATARKLMSAPAEESAESVDRVDHVVIDGWSR